MSRIVASAEVNAPPELASELIADPRLVEKWLLNASGVTADKDWPRYNSQLSWEMGKRAEDFCEARVVENRLPEYLRVEVTTPVTNKVVTHKFTAIANGRTLYEKLVDAELKGFAKILGSLGLRKARGEIEAEVQRAAASVPAVEAAPKPPMASAKRGKKAE